MRLKCGYPLRCPLKTPPRSCLFRVFHVAFLLVCGFALVPDTGVTTSPSGRNLPEPSIRLIEPGSRGGKAYRLTYFVPVPRDTYWRFKTDFDNDFVEGNEFIEEHRLLRRSGNVVITETRYTFGSDAAYRWRTLVCPGQYRLEFTLLNPEETGQEFHHGSIEAEARNGTTKVTQVAFFDFFGATFWIHYPWSGGLRDFLRSTAVWEQKTALRLRNEYAKSP
jgi:hypothetical protein